MVGVTAVLYPEKITAITITITLSPVPQGGGESDRAESIRRS